MLEEIKRLLYDARCNKYKDTKFHIKEQGMNQKMWIQLSYTAGFSNVHSYKMVLTYDIKYQTYRYTDKITCPCH